MRSSICGYSSAPNTLARTAARVSGISNGSVIGQLANPSAVAVSSTKLVVSPARSRETSSSAAVPRAMTTALSSAGTTSAFGSALRLRRHGPGLRQSGRIPACYAPVHRQSRRTCRSTWPAPPGSRDPSVSHSSLGHKVFQTVEFVDSAQSYSRARCPRAHQSEVALGYRPRAVVAAIGAAPWDRCRQGDVDLIGRVPISSMEARRCRSSGFGSRWIFDCHPSAANATTQWFSAAPQLSIRSRASGSVWGRCRPAPAPLTLSRAP